VTGSPRARWSARSGRPETPRSTCPTFTSASGAPTTRRATSIPSRCCRRGRHRPRPLPRRRLLRPPSHPLRRQRLLRCRPRRSGSATTGRPRGRWPPGGGRQVRDPLSRRPRRGHGRGRGRGRGRGQDRAALSTRNVPVKRIPRHTRGDRFVLTRPPAEPVVGEPRPRLGLRIQFASLLRPRRLRRWQHHLGPQSRRRRRPSSRRGDSRSRRCSLWRGLRFWPRAGRGERRNL
jgi:hypothetical protein